jgi:mannose-6-phosphate isomerase-like protein (cupin superfamily)
VRQSRPGFLCIIPIGLIVFLGASTHSPRQEKLKVEPDPSYSESGPAVFRHPDLDTNVDLYINHWRNSIPRQEHGGLLERDILTPGDPFRPARKGAVRKYTKAYRYAVLPPRTSTAPTRAERAQVFFYVTAGGGRLEAGRKRAALEEGTAVLVPARCEYRFSNPHSAPLEMIAVEEETAPGFIPGPEISIGSYHDSKPVVGAHWAHIAHPFLYDVEPKFSNPMGFIVVSIDNFDVAQPHSHPPGTEEIWLQLKGQSLLFFGNRLLRQEPGEAFLVPPNNKVPHCSINQTEEPMLWLFLGCRYPQDAK